MYAIRSYYDIVYAREGAINAVAFDPSTLTLGGGSIRLFEGGKTNLGSGSSYFAFSYNFV